MAVSLKTLRQFALLDGLADPELLLVSRLAREESHPAEAVLFSEGTEATALYLLVKGKVSLEKRIQLGPHGSSRMATIEILSPGASFGWSAVVAPYVYTASAVCMEPCTVVALDGPGLRRLCASNHLIGHLLMEQVARVVATRLKDTTHTLSYFLSIVSHELKAPLAAIENYLRLMLNGYGGEITEQQRLFLERSCVRVAELSELISRVLDLARMRPEEIQSDFRPVSPTEVIGLSLEDVQLSAKQKWIKLQVDVSEGLGEIVAAPERLRQVVTNLLSNAIKFTPEAGTVTLRAGEQDDSLIIEVIDTGPGIPAGDLPHIFEAFYRAAGVQERGLGLGLSIAKRIVDAHQGEIRVESPYPPQGQKGTRFTVVLPRDPRARLKNGGNQGTRE